MAFRKCVILNVVFLCDTAVTEEQTRETHVYKHGFLDCRTFPCQWYSFVELVGKPLASTARSYPMQPFEINGRSCCRCCFCCCDVVVVAVVVAAVMAVAVVFASVVFFVSVMVHAVVVVVVVETGANLLHGELLCPLRLRERACDSYRSARNL